MDYEKKYKEVLEAVRKLQETNPSDEGVQNWVNDNFPELKESENERMSREIINFIVFSQPPHLFDRRWLAWLEKQGEKEKFIKKELECIRGYRDEAIRRLNELEKQGEQKPVELSEDEKIRKQIKAFIKSRGSQITQSKTDAWIAWLEKQGEKKPSDKVEPKFKVGDCLVHKKMVGVTCCIAQIHAPHYYLTNNNSFIKFGEEDNYRPWTIQDAKDGDVLFSKGNYFKEYIFMFSSFTEDNVISTYFGYDIFHNTFDKALTRFGRVEDFISVTPATKEQRDLLFKKMHEAGYEWDADKKELRKIEQKPVEWSEEDEERMNNLIQHLKIAYSDCEWLEKTIYWLKSLKDKVLPQQKQEWNEEDERIMKIIKDCLKKYNRGIILGTLCAVDYADCIAWLEKQVEQKKY